VWKLLNLLPWKRRRLEDELAREQVRDTWVWTWLDNRSRDLQYADVCYGAVRPSR
jgi:hypothetical protein